MFPDLKQSILWSEDLLLIKCFGAGFMCEVRLCEQHQNVTENRVLVTKNDTLNRVLVTKNDTLNRVLVTKNDTLNRVLVTKKKKTH